MGNAKKRFKKRYRRLRRPLEWLLIWLALGLIPRLSLRGVLRLARCMANLGYLFDRKGCRVARANLKVMYGARLTPYRANLIVKHSYYNMARVLLNIFWVSHHSRERLESLIVVPTNLIETLKQNQPSINVSAHFGNWEIMSQATAINGVPMVSVAKKIGSDGMTRRLIRARSLIGQKIVTTEGALRKLLSALRAGESIGLIMDQHTQPWHGGIWVEFFGLPVGITTTPAALARKLNLPIFFSWSRPLKDGRYSVQPAIIFWPDQNLSVQERTQEIIATFEKTIRRFPSLWCLNYRRWRHILPDTDAQRYPFYATPIPASRLDNDDDDD